ncbi:hypothetical protein Daes_1849 [Pseudodesulfovibrio aespoeensis Aspo-2]|uniref:Uncharacterized protein n=1 Tax=Pseudodesulfovibrio aespoeensis (strain ATCC 700646 / DSM 10631 / Aspo-2) TaxID=643562 RepID=E6VZ85_PSEA9|nr:hypothetical protein Daes_1849 [Pseudodesulfovibrio aespoeensis Aspo-2]
MTPLTKPGTAGLRLSGGKGAFHAPVSDLIEAPSVLMPLFRVLA